MSVEFFQKGSGTASSNLGGVTDWLRSPVQETQKLLAERAASKTAETAQKRAAEEAEWKRSGEPWSKKADNLLTIAKWGIITVPIGILAISLMPLLRGAGSALSGAGLLTREGAESLKAVRGAAARRNPSGNLPRDPLLESGLGWLGWLSRKYAETAALYPPQDALHQFYRGHAEGLRHFVESTGEVARGVCPETDEQFRRGYLNAFKLARLYLMQRSQKPPVIAAAPAFQPLNPKP